MLTLFCFGATKEDRKKKDSPSQWLLSRVFLPRSVFSTRTLCLSNVTIHFEDQTRPMAAWWMLTHDGGGGSVLHVHCYDNLNPPVLGSAAALPFHRSIYLHHPCFIAFGCENLSSSDFYFPCLVFLRLRNSWWRSFCRFVVGTIVFFHPEVFSSDDYFRCCCLKIVFFFKFNIQYKVGWPSDIKLSFY